MCIQWLSRAAALLAGVVLAGAVSAAESPFPGERGAALDSMAWESIWDEADPPPQRGDRFLREFVKAVPRDEVVGFALYTHQRGVLKMTAQLYPLKPGEAREVRLELKRGEAWEEVAKAPVVYPGWFAHFRVEGWDGSQAVPYRVRHGEAAVFEGLVRKDPVEKDEIVVGSLSCNSKHDRGGRDEIVANLLAQDPDLLFFAGDQSYDHEQHTAAWLLWGKQFREVIKNRPVITIPDDHDVGHANLWGEAGGVASTPAGPDGGYFYPAGYVKMVEAAQTWHLPDPPDPAPVGQGIGVYFTSLNVGGIDFAVLEDRKFKTGPEGVIPEMGPRPDHINEPGYDPKKIDLPEVDLLGERQMEFLGSWGEDWTGAEIKAVLSQTAFCGAVHLHGGQENRLLADLDCNGWPQHGRNAALRALRRAHAVHLCGDQHLAVVVKHGIDEFRDGPFGFTNPATVNTIYGRWWWPENEQAGGGEPVGTGLPWTGDYPDGLYNKITMFAYANPNFTNMAEARRMQDENRKVDLGDGYGLVRFDKTAREITFECWPRFASVADGDAAQFAGWPITLKTEDNDGRDPDGHLPELVFEGAENPVVQVTREADGEVLYTVRVLGGSYRPPVFGEGPFAVKVGRDRPDGWAREGVEVAGDGAGPIAVPLGER